MNYDMQYTPYIRCRGTEKQAIQYANKFIRTEDPDQDYETLQCYHEIKCGVHQNKMMSMPLEKIAQINEWMHNVEKAFGLGDYNV